MSHHWDDKKVTGMLSQIIRDTDERPAREQIAERYAHGGGYLPRDGVNWTLGVSGGEQFTLYHPDYPPMPEVARIDLPCGETVVLFDRSFVAIIKPMLSFVIVRMD